MRRSNDAGKTWTAPVRLFQQVGSNGAAALVIDSSNTLHMFFGNRISGSPDTHGLWHSIWQDGGWSLPEAIVSGPKMFAETSDEEAFDPAQAQAMIVNGNLLMVVWRQDPGSGGIHIHYTYTRLNTPELALSTPPSPYQAQK
jgi:hypothetical protein